MRDKVKQVKTIRISPPATLPQDGLPLTNDWLGAQIGDDQVARMSLGDAHEAEKPIVGGKDFHLSVGEGVLGAEGDELLEGHQVRGIVAA